MPVAHHDVCFGCGLANVFGLHLEAESQPDGSLAGRFFVKQDHQGPSGFAHGGVVAAALDEAMALLLHAQGVHARTVHLELDLDRPAPVGSFVEVEARLERREGRKLWLSAAAEGERGSVGRARGTFVEV